MSWVKRLVTGVQGTFFQGLSEKEEPEVVLSKFFEQMQQNLATLRQTVAGAIAMQKRIERQLNENQRLAKEYYHQARVALSEGNEKSAKIALIKRQSYQKNAAILQVDLEKRMCAVKNLSQQLFMLESKMVEAKLKKDIYLARLLASEAALSAEKLQEQLTQASATELIENKIVMLEAELELLQALNKAKISNQ